jgi:hypothetical protein
MEAFNNQGYAVNIPEMQNRYSADDFATKTLLVGRLLKEVKCRDAEPTKGAGSIPARGISRCHG